MCLGEPERKREQLYVYSFVMVAFYFQSLALFICSCGLRLSPGVISLARDGFASNCLLCAVSGKYLTFLYIIGQIVHYIHIVFYICLLLLCF